MIRTGGAALNQTPMDWDGNLSRIEQAVTEAKASGVQMLFFPELAITGYGCEDMFLSQHTLNKSLNQFKKLKDLSQNLLIGIGLPIQFNENVYNAYGIICNGDYLGFDIKPEPPTSGLYYEKRWFSSWNNGPSDLIKIDDIQIPIGNLKFSVSDIQFKIDWSVEAPSKNTLVKNDLVICPLARPFSFLKYKERKTSVLEITKGTECNYINLNLLGNEAGKLIYDGGIYIIESGKLKAETERFGFTDSNLAWSDLSFENKPIDLENTIRSKHYFKHSLQESTSGIRIEPFEDGVHIKEEEFSRAVSLGLFDYLRKSKSNGFMISLSGGADSSACLTLCSLMIKRAIHQIGIDRFKHRLGHIKGIQNAVNDKDIILSTISTVYQATANSSETTLNAASSLAHECGAQFYNINIDAIVRQYTHLIEESINRKLNWAEDDLALQNIQARVRVPGVWMFTNIKNFLLITTSNRSEASVGYCTMDGDTAGSIAPISGVDKSWLKNWLIWLEKTGYNLGGDFIKYKELKYVNSLAPTAELRPQGSLQTDEKDLMPYPVLNIIESMLVKEKMSPMECYNSLLATEKGYEKADLATWVIRFFTLWERNQWKRERAAVGFHLDDYNLDPASWMKFPVLSSAFDDEIAQLKTIAYKI